MTPSVSVVIPHYGDLDLAACTDTVAETAPGVEVCVWDGNRRNHQFAGNCNRAARDASGDVLVFLNNDCYPHPGWLESLLQPLEAHQIAGGVLFRPDGQIHHAGVSVARVAGLVHAQEMTHPTTPGPRHAVTGALLAIRADTFWAAGGFDEEYRNGYEDVDLCLTVGDCWLSGAHATHLVSASGPERYAHAAHNIARLREKHGY